MEVRLLPVQKRLLDSASPFSGIYGGRGLGKSYILSVLAVKNLFEGRSSMIWGQNFRSLKDVLFDNIKSRLSEWGLFDSVSVNMSDMTIAHGNRRIIGMSYENLDACRGYSDISMQLYDEIATAPRTRPPRSQRRTLPSLTPRLNAASFGQMKFFSTVFIFVSFRPSSGEFKKVHEVKHRFAGAWAQRPRTHCTGWADWTRRRPNFGFRRGLQPVSRPDPNGLPSDGKTASEREQTGFPVRTVPESARGMQENIQRIAPVSEEILYIWGMEIKWNEEKEIWLMRERGVSLSRLAERIEAGDAVVAFVDNQAGHPGQRMFIVTLDGYPHCVPFVVGDDGVVFLKTAFKSRKRKKKEAGNG